LGRHYRHQCLGPEYTINVEEKNGYKYKKRKKKKNVRDKDYTPTTNMRSPKKNKKTLTCHKYFNYLRIWKG